MYLFCLWALVIYLSLIGYHSIIQSNHLLINIFPIINIFLKLNDIIFHCFGSEIFSNVIIIRAFNFVINVFIFFFPYLLTNNISVLPFCFFTSNIILFFLFLLRSFEFLLITLVPKHPVLSTTKRRCVVSFIVRWFSFVLSEKLVIGKILSSF